MQSAEADGIDIRLHFSPVLDVLEGRMASDVAAGGWAWYLLTITWADGVFTVTPDYEHPPTTTVRGSAGFSRRAPGAYVTDLEMYPRAPDRVPGWMKVELAAVGGWDLVADRPTYKNYEPTGVPMTPESAGVPVPPGGEYALPYDAPVLAEIRANLPAKQQPGHEPPRRMRRLLDRAKTAMSAPRPRRPMDPAPFAHLYARWQTLAERYPGMITLDDGEGWQRDDFDHVPESLRAAAAAFPSVSAGGWSITWLTHDEAGPQNPELGAPEDYQVLQNLGRETTVVRLDATGNAGEVVRAYEETITVLAPDLLTFLTALTEHVEHDVTSAWAQAQDDVAEDDPDLVNDPEAVSEFAVDYLDIDGFLEGRPAQ